METVTKQKCLNIIDMLNSPDQENKVVALGVLEQLDFQENLIQILLCKKWATIPVADWEEHAPKTFKKLKENIYDINKVITYKDIIMILVDNEVPAEQIDFYLDNFSDYLLGQIKNLGYNFIEDIEMNIKLTPEYEQSRKLSESV